MGILKQKKRGFLFLCYTAKMVCMLSKDNTGEEINSLCCYTTLRANVNLGEKKKSYSIMLRSYEIISAG